MPAGPDQIIRDLLERPFGPYLDETILSDKCQHTSSKRLVLEHLMLSYRGKPTGYSHHFSDLQTLTCCSFDRTEFIGPFVPSNVTHLLPPTEAGSYVQFRGVLSIPALSHLSDTGLRYLNHDLRERLMGTIVNGIASARKHLAVTIEAIFESKTKQKQLPKLEVRVLIQGIMCSKASFMRCKSSTSIQLYVKLMHLQLMLLQMDCCYTRQTPLRQGDVNSLSTVIYY